MAGSESNSALTLRLLRPDDLAFADRLRSLVGWNQTPSDWRRFLSLEPNGCFLAEWEGRPAGTATTLRYGLELAWIGMVLVHPDLRRRGIGRALLTHGIEHLRSNGVRRIRLDATPLGRHVYDPLGFQDEWTITRWEHPRWEDASPPASEHIRPLNEADLPAIDRLDAVAFGVSRRHLVQALIRDGLGAAVWQADHEPGGYGLLRPGSRAHYLGPISAERPEAGLALATHLLAHAAGHPVFWDIPDSNRAASAWARERGFTPQRVLTRMRLGDDGLPGDPTRIFALSGPAMG